tara:strand:- start:2703 stop:3620 length:918 start_codon:yes stop_codon:yes gene_type:complete
MKCDNCKVLNDIESNYCKKCANQLDLTKHECIICFTNNSDAIKTKILVMDCGHIICELCESKVMVCPLCTKNIKEIDSETWLIYKNRTEKAIENAVFTTIMFPNEKAQKYVKELVINNIVLKAAIMVELQKITNNPKWAKLESEFIVDKIPEILELFNGIKITALVKIKQIIIYYILQQIEKKLNEINKIKYNKNEKTKCNIIIKLISINEEEMEIEDEIDDEIGDEITEFTDEITESVIIELNNEITEITEITDEITESVINELNDEIADENTGIEGELFNINLFEERGINITGPGLYLRGFLK